MKEVHILPGYITMATYAADLTCSGVDHVWDKKPSGLKSLHTDHSDPWKQLYHSSELSVQTGGGAETLRKSKVQILRRSLLTFIIKKKKTGYKRGTIYTLLPRIRFVSRLSLCLNSVSFSSQSIKHNQHCKGNNKPVSHTSKHSLCGAAVIRSSRVFMSVNLHSRHFCRFSFLASNKLSFINILKAKSTKLTILQRFPFTHMLILMPSEWNVFNIVCASHSFVFPFHRSAPSRSLHVSDWSDALTRLSERWRTDPGWLIKLLTTSQPNWWSQVQWSHIKKSYPQTAEPAWTAGLQRWAGEGWTGVWVSSGGDLPVMSAFRASACLLGRKQRTGG